MDVDNEEVTSTTPSVEDAKDGENAAENGVMEEESEEILSDDHQGVILVHEHQQEINGHEQQEVALGEEQQDLGNGIVLQLVEGVEGDDEGHHIMQVVEHKDGMLMTENGHLTIAENEDGHYTIVSSEDASADVMEGTSVSGDHGEVISDTAHVTIAAGQNEHPDVEEEEEEDVEYDLDEPALLLTDKGKLFICVYCGMVSLLVSQVRSHIKICRQRNKEPALEIPALEIILCKINDRLKPLIKGKKSAVETEENEEAQECKDPQILDIVEKAMNVLIKKNEKKKRVCEYCTRIFYSISTLRKHMEEQCAMRPDSDSDDEVRIDPSGEITVLPLTITPLGDVCECDHQDEFTSAANMLVEKLLKRTNEIFFQGVCGNIFKVEAGRRKRQREASVTAAPGSKSPKMTVEVDENGDPCGKFPCPLCKVVLFESRKLDEHLKTHTVKDSSARCDYCHNTFPYQQLKVVEKLQN